MPKCRGPECDRDTECKGGKQRLCQAHRQQLRRTGEMRPLFSSVQMSECRIDGCGKKPVAFSLCAWHYRIQRCFKTAEDAGVGCEVPGCALAHYSKGMCYTHYTTARNRAYAERLGLISA